MLVLVFRIIFNNLNKYKTCKHILLLKRINWLYSTKTGVCIYRWIRHRQTFDCLVYNYLCNQCLSPLILWVRLTIRPRCTTLCYKVCQWLVTGRWFSPVSSTNKTDRHDIADILLKVALNTITPNPNPLRTFK
jgi:hypothetical protein